MSQQTITDYEKRAEQRARHRALILQILRAHPNGLTTQQIMTQELDRYGYTFLTDNRLRELREQRLIESIKGSDDLLRWKIVSVNQGQGT